MGNIILGMYGLFCLSIYLLLWVADYQYHDRAKELRLIKIQDKNFIKKLISNIVAIIWCIIPIWNLLVLMGIFTTISKNNEYDADEFIKTYKCWERR